MEERISMVHGSGGAATSELIGAIFAKEFANKTLDRMEDSAVVDGAGNYQTVAGFEFGSQFIYHVIKDALSVSAAAAGDAAPNVLVAYQHSFHFNAFLAKNRFHFRQSGGSVALRPGTSVEH